MKFLQVLMVALVFLLVPLFAQVGDITENGMSQGSLVRHLQRNRDLTNELRTDHATYKTLVDEVKVLLNVLRTQELTRCVTPPNFEIDTNMDIRNGDAFEIISGGVQITIATEQSFDTGTGTVVTTAAYHAAGILSIDIGGTTYVDWGAEDELEAGAITNLAVVTASGEVVCGYVTVHAKAAQDFVAGTDALEGGSGGEVSQDTNYFNNQYVGAAAMGIAVAGSSPGAVAAAALALTAQ